jgi:hypothetical protein
MLLAIGKSLSHLLHPIPHYSKKDVLHPVGEASRGVVIPAPRDHDKMHSSCSSMSPDVNKDVTLV